MTTYKDIKYPTTPSYIIENYPELLTPPEKSEIQSYSEIYYIRKAPITIDWTPDKENKQYYDEKGNYKVIVGEHLCYQYEILDVVGFGGSSRVVKCYDHKLKERVAIKIFQRVQNINVVFSRELAMLRNVNGLDENDLYFVKMNDYAAFRDTMLIVFELMSEDLHKVLANSVQGLRHEKFYKVTIALCKAIQVLHDCQIIHLDLKPHNIGFKNVECIGLKLLDFGMSCYNHSNRKYLVRQTRWYQCPEVMLGGPVTEAADVWALGCIIAEIWTGHTLFKGKSEGDQFAAIVEMLGLPPGKFLNKCDTTKLSKFLTADWYPLYCEIEVQGSRVVYYPKIPTNKSEVRGPPKSKKLLHFLRESGDVNPGLLDLLHGCLSWDPEDRLTVSDVLLQLYMIMPATSQSTVPSNLTEDPDELSSGDEHFTSCRNRESSVSGELFTALRSRMMKLYTPRTQKIQKNAGEGMSRQPTRYFETESTFSGRGSGSSFVRVSQSAMDENGSALVEFNVDSFCKITQNEEEIFYTAPF